MSRRDLIQNQFHPCLYTMPRHIFLLKKNINKCPQQIIINHLYLFNKIRLIILEKTKDKKRLLEGNRVFTQKKKCKVRLEHLNFLIVLCLLDRKFQAFVLCLSLISLSVCLSSEVTGSTVFLVFLLRRERERK